MKKPDERIYKLLLNRYQIDGSQALFLDDSAANVKGSIEAGLPAIQFHDPMQLRKDLQARGVL